MSDIETLRHPDPERSYGLPGEYYVSPAIYHRERERIFADTWVYVGHGSRIPAPGDYVVADVAGESIVVLRDERHQVRAFYNVCRHRAHQLLDDEGNCGQRIRCPYHAWAYDLEGRLIAARNHHKVDGFDFGDFALHALHQFHGLVLDALRDHPGESPA